MHRCIHYIDWFWVLYDDVRDIDIENASPRSRSNQYRTIEISDGIAIGMGRKEDETKQKIR